MTEETKETCRMLINRVFNQIRSEEFETMFTPSPPWQPTSVGPSGEEVVIKHIQVPSSRPDFTGMSQPQEMSMRKFCQHMWENFQDEMLAIVQAHREPRKNVKDTNYPFFYRRPHDEAAVDDLNKAAKLKNITIKGDRVTQVDSYGDYRAEYLNYKSYPSSKKMNITVTNQPPAKITTFVSDNELSTAISLAKELAELETQKAPLLEIKRKAENVVTTTELKLKQIEADQRQKIRDLKELQNKG